MDTRKIAVVASVAAVVLALSGCSTGNAEEPTSSASTVEAAPSATSPKSVSPSASETDKYEPASANGPAKNVPVPNLPAAAKKNSEEGAAAFAEYYFELINYVIQTNDAEPLKKSTTRECEICGKSLIDPAGRAQISGKWQVGGEHIYKVVDSYKSSSDKAIVTVRFEVESADFYIKPNELESSKDKRPSKVAGLGMAYDSGWKVYIIDIEKSSK